MSTQPAFRRRAPFLLLSVLALASLTACGTLTGLPAHGGGKRFATEQRLVSASIRSALQDIDVTSLKGKRAALIFDLVADEGGGNFNGGRWSPGLLFSVGSALSPTTTTTNAFQVFNLGESGSNYSNTSSSGGSVSSSTTLQSGTNTSTGSNTNTGASDTSGSNTSTGTNTSTGSSTGSSTTNGSSTNTGTGTSTGSSTNTSTTTNNGSSAGTSSSTTGGTTTNTNFNQTDNSTNVTNGSGTNTGSSTTTGSGTNASTTTNTGTNTTNGSNTASGTNASATNSSNNGTNASNGNNTGQSTTTTSSRNNGANRTQGGFNSHRETLSPSPTQSTTVTEGTQREHTATLQYKGLGEYQNFNVPKSDASLLMGLVRNYMLLNGVIPTTPTDPNAEVLVYVTVDIFGTVRSRFDALLYNNETVKAETSFEVMAFDRSGNNIMRPQVANRESQYREHYLLWAGPITSQEKVYQGQGLLVDFTQVDGKKGKYNPAEPVLRNHPGGKN